MNSPGCVDLPDHVDLVAADLEHGDGDDEIGDVASEPLDELAPQLLDGLADGADVAGEREGESPVGADEHLLG